VQYEKILFIISIIASFLAYTSTEVMAGGKGSGRKGSNSSKKHDKKGKGTGKKCGKGYISADKTCHKDDASKVNSSSVTPFNSLIEPNVPTNEQATPIFQKGILLPESDFPRTYQWEDNRTKTPYLSGRMPYWYEGKIQHPNPPCTIVWQRGTIVDNTCEKDEELAKQYAQSRKDFIIERDEQLRRNKRIEKLKEEGRVEIGLTEKEVIYILGQPIRITDEVTESGMEKRLMFEETNNRFS
jgi:hypothetical protein